MSYVKVLKMTLGGIKKQGRILKLQERWKDKAQRKCKKHGNTRHRGNVHLGNV